ncbi:MAG: hypothetical protein KY443_11205 [Actinobacteria bacterium]|nr:hypothetical protein [Actinomycetota bacterium]
MTIVLAVGAAAALVNLWGFVDTWFHPRRQWRRSGRSRAMWASLTLAGFACGASTAPWLVPLSVYIAIAYAAAAHPFLKDGVRAA